MVVTPEFRKVVRQLPKSMQRRIYGPAVAAGAQVIRREAIAKLGGDRKDIVTQKQRRSRVGAVVSYAVGVAKDRWFLAFKEYGRQELIAKGKAIPMHMEDGSVVFTKRAKAVPPRPFLRPAFATHGEKAMQKVGERLLIGLDRETRKLAGSFAQSGLGRRRRRR